MVIDTLLIFDVVICLCCLWATVTDIKRMEIPDLIIGIMFIFAFVRHALYGDLMMALGLGVGSFCLIFFLALLRDKFRGDPGIGGGDIKLIGALVFWIADMEVGSIPAVAVFFVSAPLIHIIWVVISRKAGEVAFAPALSCSAVILFLFSA